MTDHATTQKPAYFQTPVFLGGPMDGLQWCSLPYDAIKVFMFVRGGCYRLTGYRKEGKEAVYTWEVTK
jgi:hypothetical protein